MYEQSKIVVRNRKIFFLLTLLFGLLVVWIGLTNFHSMYLAISGSVIALLSGIFYALSELEWRFGEAIKDFIKPKEDDEYFAILIPKKNLLSKGWDLKGQFYAMIMENEIILRKKKEE